MQESAAPNWKDKAEELFFGSRKKITVIAAELGMSRKAISAHLKACGGFAEEKERRKEENAERRKEYQADWEKANRRIENDFSGMPLRQRHELDVRILSRECFFYE